VKGKKKMKAARKIRVREKEKKKNNYREAITRLPASRMQTDHERTLAFEGERRGQQLLARWSSVSRMR
jgi:hypothetical protein